MLQGDFQDFVCRRLADLPQVVQRARPLAEEILHLVSSAEFDNTATREMSGFSCLSNSSCLFERSSEKLDNPVTLPPGRLKLSIKPAPTGSPPVTIIMGAVRVASI